MGEIHLVAESIIPQDKGSWDQPRCVTGGQEVAEGQVPGSPAQGGSVCPHEMWRGVWAAGNARGQQTAMGEGTVSVRPQQEGRMNGFSENLHHLVTGYSFIYIIFLLTVTNNCYTYHTPRAINNFSPGAIFLKRWHVRSLYIGLCSKSQF